jgi:hypothetical protein
MLSTYTLLVVSIPGFQDPVLPFMIQYSIPRLEVNAGTENPDFRSNSSKLLTFLSLIPRITIFLIQQVQFSNTLNKSRYFMRYC